MLLCTSTLLHFRGEFYFLFHSYCFGLNRPNVYSKVLYIPTIPSHSWLTFQFRNTDSDALHRLETQNLWLLLLFFNHPWTPKSPNSSGQNPLPEGRCAAAPLVFPLCCGWESRASHHLAVQRQRTRKVDLHVHAAHPWLRWRISEARLSLPQQAHPHQQWQLHSDCAEQTGKGWGHGHWDVYGEPLRPARSWGDNSRWLPETVFVAAECFFLLRSIH